MWGGIFLNLGIIMWDLIFQPHPHVDFRGGSSPLHPNVPAGTRRVLSCHR